ncbi:tetratricopeptide repeat protein [Providencia manganoxydans]|uniref:tetratricopeptide repeat protein n=1 Tax=Providencia manganoxydans TaxID=2923283 RepID=UPI003B9CE68E
MLRPESKGNEILDTLTSSMLAGEMRLLPIDVMRAKREIDKLDDPVLKLHLKGIIAILSRGDVDEGITLCERAITLNPTDSLYWNNYVVTLRSAGLFKKHNEFIEKSSSKLIYYPNVIGYELFMMGVFSLRIDVINDVILNLEKMNLSIDDVGINDEDRRTAMLMWENSSLINQFRPMVDCLFDVVDHQYKGSISSFLKKDIDGTMTYVFRVGLNFEQVTDLNEQLFELLYDKNLLTSDCCIYIESEGLY